MVEERRTSWTPGGAAAEKIATPSCHRRDSEPEPPAIIGPWRISAPLGRGGMGVVYRAEHTETGALAALKTVSVTDESLLSSIRREIHALRGVEHPGVVRILDEGVQGGLPWYAMELLEGRTLRDHHRERRRRTADWDCEPTVSLSNASVAQTRAATTDAAPSTRLPSVLPPSAPRPYQRAAGGALTEALTVLRAVCCPLAFVHGSGLVHRDLKPDNVFIRDSGAPVLFDFGLAFQFEGAKGRDVLQAGGKLMGSPEYMAPEQIRGDLVDARADLYALGCMLYEAVTGTVPFLGDTAGAVLSMHLYAQPIPPAQLVPDVPPALDALILRLLQKRPRDRLGYADDVATALAALGALGPEEVPQQFYERAPAAQPYLYRPGLAGRSAPLGRINEALQRAREARRGCLVLVGGESGVGKTRLAVEAANEATHLQMTVITGACAAVSAESSDGSGVRAAPLHPFRQLLLAVADRCNELGPEAYDRLLGPRGRVLAPYEPALGQLLGHERYPEAPELTPEAARYRLRSAIAETLAALAAEEPVLLVLDDLQWADEHSRGVLEHLRASYFDENAVVVLGTYRAEETSAALAALTKAPWVARIDLGRLDHGAVDRMVRDMLAMDAPPGAFVAYLLDQSEGNPFFIAEYLRAAIQERLLSRDGSGAWRIRASADAGPDAAQLAPGALAAALPLPGSLRALVARRLSGVSPRALELAELASVLGREQEERVLIAAAGLGDADVLDAIAELGARQVLEETEPGRLRFVHDKLREIIYAGISDRARGAMHGAVARAIEARYLDAPDRALSFPLLAHHYAKASDRDKTLEYLEKAGAQALATGASGDARDLFRKAIELDAAQPQGDRVPELRRARWERRLGEACYNLGDLRGAERHCVAAIEVLSTGAAWIFGHRRSGARPPLPVRARPVLGGLWQLGRQMAHLAGVPIEITRDEAERERLIEASLAAERLSQAYLFQNEASLAFMAALTTTNAAARLGPSPSLARGYATLSVAFGYIPWPAVVRAYGARAEQTAGVLGDPQAISFVTLLVGLTAIGEGRCREARAYLGRAEQLAEALQDRRRKEECLALIGAIDCIEGRWVASLDRYSALTAEARQSDNVQGHIWAQSGRAQCRLLLGDGEGATAILTELAGKVREAGDRAQQIAHGQIALGHLLCGDVRAAREAAERTLALIRHGKPAGFHCLRGYTATCEVLLALEEQARSPRERRELARLSGDACRAFARAARIFPFSRPEALRMQGLACWLDGERARARQLWAKAIEEAERRELTVYEARARYELARHLDKEDPERARLLARAHAIFASLDLDYWQRRVDQLRRSPAP